MLKWPILIWVNDLIVNNGHTLALSIHQLPERSIKKIIASCPSVSRFILVVNASQIVNKLINITSLPVHQED